MTPAIKRLKMYLDNPDMYYVYHERYGCLEYYLVVEKHKGIIDKIQKRTFDKAIQNNIISLNQYLDQL